MLLLKNAKTVLSLLIAMSLPACSKTSSTPTENVGNSTSAREEKEGDGIINVGIYGPDLQQASITLYQDGKSFATKDIPLLTNSHPNGSSKFSCLPFGTYEVRVETPGHVTVVKRVILREADKLQELKIYLTKGEGSTLLGPGPSIQKLETRIRNLEEAVGKIQSK